MSTNKDKEFRAWMRAIDVLLLNQIGFTTGDLGDIPYRDYFNDGLSPDEIVEILAEEEGFYGLL